MAMVLRFLRIPQPKRFLGFFDLQTGAELIYMTTLINKCAGVFGVLAVLTGASISLAQASMYLYSLGLFVLLVVMGSKIHDRNPLASISFAYIYLIDTFVNGLYTVLFAISWFIVISETASHQDAAAPVSNAGNTIDSASGFTNPITNASKVEVVAAPAAGWTEGQDAVAIPSFGKPESAFGAGVLQPESFTSIFFISALWVIRFYFIVVCFSFARQVVREKATLSEAPFEGSNGGQGWRGKLGRALINVHRGYWVGEGWTEFGRKFRRFSGPNRRGSEDGRIV